MQLFLVSQIEQRKDQIFLSNVSELLIQLRKVLRAKIGDHIFVQSLQPGFNNTIVRYELKITNRSDEDLVGECINRQLGLPKGRINSMLIALPNKREKVEFIVQKLSEIGIDKILFRATERSVITQWNERKANRLYKIAKEAVEQSRGRNIPDIMLCDDVKYFSKDKQVIIFDIPHHFVADFGGIEENDSRNTFFESSSFFGKLENYSTGLLGVVGPEGGLTKRDYQFFDSYEVVGLGKTVLRMETAAVIGGWMLKNA